MADNDTASAEQQAEQPDPGRALRQARESLDLSIEEVATELRMEPGLLRALEECRFEALGAPVFAKGYLKQYGNRLGLDYGDLLADYYRIVGQTDVRIEPSRAIKLRDERAITVWIIAALALALLAVFLFVWWLDNTAVAPTATVESPAASVGSDASAALPPPIPETAAGADATPRESEAALAGRAVEPPDGAAPEPAPDSPARMPPADTAATAAPGVEAVSTPAVPESEDSATAPVAAAPFVGEGQIGIEIVFRDDCWTEVTDADGEQLYYGLGRAGSRANLAGTPPVRVFLGNADGVAIRVDGAPFAVPSASRQGNLARFIVDDPTD